MCVVCVCVRSPGKAKTTARRRRATECAYLRTRDLYRICTRMHLHILPHLTHAACLRVHARSTHFSFTSHCAKHLFLVILSSHRLIETSMLAKSRPPLTQIDSPQLKCHLRQKNLSLPTMHLTRSKAHILRYSTSSHRFCCSSKLISCIHFQILSLHCVHPLSKL